MTDRARHHDPGNPGHLSRSLAVVVLLFLAGCGAGQNTQTVAIATSAADDTAAPATETTGNEPPQSPKPTKVSVSLPGLPVGGSAQATDDPAVQCVFVNWQQSAPAIPGNFAVSLTGIRLEPADAFKALNAGCGGVHACLDRGFRLTSDGATCSLALKFTGQPTGGNPTLSASAGTVTCPIEATVRCEAFATDVAHTDLQALDLIPLEPGIGSPSDNNSPSPTGSG